MPPEGQITSDSDLESVISCQVDKTKARRNSCAEKYFCSIEGCNQSFKRLDHLDRHVFKHTGIKKHACHFDGCSKTYSILTHLKRHIRCTHERSSKEPNRNIPCDVDTCDKMFTSLCNMHRHVREVHENPKVYNCQFCGEKFTQKLKLRRHEITRHTGVFPHNCEKCSKGFYQKWQWERHQETCKVYICITCNEKFDKWTVFLKHCKDTQHSLQYYKCEFCESAYVKPSDLQKHVAAKHLSDGTGEYKCHHAGCGRIYSYERNLRQHILTAHEGKKFPCTENGCDKLFSSLQNVQKHIERDHKAEFLPSKKNLITQRKKRKDAGKRKSSNLAKMCGISVCGDLNEKLKSRDAEALDAVVNHLSQDMDVDSSFSESDVIGSKNLKTNSVSLPNARAIDVNINGVTKNNELFEEKINSSQHKTNSESTNIKSILKKASVNPKHSSHLTLEPETLPLEHILQQQIEDMLS